MTKLHHHAAAQVKPAGIAFPGMGVPRRISTKGTEGVITTVTITTCHGQIWMSIMPPFTWEAIMEPETVDELIHVLEGYSQAAKK